MPNHTLPAEDLDLKEAIHKERHLLEEVDVPIVTISATYRKELADKYKSVSHSGSDVVFSRAHFSMAEAVKQAALELNKTSYMSDPTNFVSEKQWASIEFTETTGQIMARFKPLKMLKDKIDTVVRNKLPITKAIIEPLDYLTGKTKNPVISLHYEVGNLLANKGKKIVQVVTDPHVRPQYLNSLPSKDVVFCVFDEETKNEFLNEATRQNKEVSPDQIIVTGPPVDPRVSKLSKNKNSISKDEPIKLAICTGGLGTNFFEVKEVLDRLTPLVKNPRKVKLFLYAGTHRDFRNYFEHFADKNHLRIGNLEDEEADIRILYEDSIVDANNNLIKYMFPWAHGIITKPSGDMAYDGAAAGCFMFFLEPWGEWEVNIQKRFVDMKIGFDIKPSEVYDELLQLHKKGNLNKAIENAKTLPSEFRNGSKNIVKVQQGLI